MEGYFNVIIAFITGVLGPLSVLFLKSYLDKRKKKPDMVHETLRVSELINQKIEHIREEFHADRVWVTQFHNGGNFYPTGKSMAKFSVMYETVNTGVSSIQTNFHYIAEESGSKSGYLFAIKTIDDRFIGTLGLDYTKRKTKLDMESINHLQVHATAIGGVLMTHLEQ